MLFKRFLVVGLVLCLLISLPVSSVAGSVDPGYYDEPYRNQFHFSPEANWMNDPNGMVYHDGEYHLFYQYYPYGRTWGPMHWGHAVSEDLVRWEHLPLALAPDEYGDIFSGSAVIDHDNTAGFGKDTMIAIFTHSGPEGQVQSIAYSHDNGRTWSKYEGNPVMPDPPVADWRDPKVFWHDESEHWVMALAADDRIMFYTSPDFKKWEDASEFGPDGGIQANAYHDEEIFTLSPQRGGDFTYEADITLVLKNGREGSGGLVFRSDQYGDNAYVAELNAKENEVKLIKVKEGEKQTLAKESWSLETFETYALQVKTEKDQIQVLLDGETIIEEQDASFLNGQFGLMAWNSTAEYRNVHFNNETNFLTNLSGLQEVSGNWETTNKGLVAEDDKAALLMSEQQADQLYYEVDVIVDKGTGSLVFRADADAKNGYMTSLDADADQVRIEKIENGEISVISKRDFSITDGESYRVKVSAVNDQISVSINNEKLLEVEDQGFEAGHFGLQVSNGSVIFQNVYERNYINTDSREIENSDFETGDLTGWTSVRGDAFMDHHVTDATEWWGGTFNHEGTYHYWGYNGEHGGDRPTGVMHSSYFTLDGSGEINLLIGGGYNPDDLFVSLMRAPDDQELLRQPNTKFNGDETYRRYVWDASEFLGEVLYLKVVDRATGGWGHINLDDVNVYNIGDIPKEVDQVASEPEPYIHRTEGQLTDWDALSGDWVDSTYGNYGGVWECPALLELPVDGDPSQSKWVLQVSVQDGAIAGGSGMQYFIGDFDGTTFTSDHPPEEVLWSDYGSDYYAGVEWSNVEGENGERYWLAWMSNWQYANDTPTSNWRSSMSLVRKMELTNTKDGLQLRQTPVGMESLREQKQRVKLDNERISGESDLLSDFSGDAYELIAKFDVTDTTATEFGFQVRKGDSNEYALISYDVLEESLFVDRSNSGEFDFGTNVNDLQGAPMQADNGTVKIHAFVDRSSIEVFGNDGLRSITSQIFPQEGSEGLQLYSEGGEVTLKSLELYPLRSIWGKSPVKTNLSSWSTVNGTWADTINGKQGQDPEEDAFIMTDHSGANIVFEARVELPDSDKVDNPIGAGALVFHSDENAENAYVANVDVRNNAVKLLKRENGNATELVVYDDKGRLELEPNKEYRLQVVTSGERIQVKLDNEIVIDTMDDTFTKGYVGLGVSNTTAFFNHIQMRDYKVNGRVNRNKNN
ncbi:GH32 C-terminal domain-containing protein [Halalkalibacter alkaliphilus]